MARKKRLLSFEQLAQHFVEGSLSRLFGGQLTTLEAATQLHRLLEDREQQGIIVSACRLHLYPSDYAQMRRHSADLPAEIRHHLTQLMKQSGLRPSLMPLLEIVEDPGQTPHQIQISTEEIVDEEETTQIFKVQQTASSLMTAIHELDAFLIINGQQHVPLTQPVVNLGRHVDNEVVLDSPTVSRRHAQIRWRYGRFVLYDLGSRVGTRLNGQLTRESVLTTGDVITLSSDTLIYAEGLSASDRTAQPTAVDEDLTLAFHPLDDDERDSA